MQKKLPNSANTWCTYKWVYWQFLHIPNESEIKKMKINKDKNVKKNSIIMYHKNYNQEYLFVVRAT